MEEQGIFKTMFQARFSGMQGEIFSDAIAWEMYQATV